MNGKGLVEDYTLAELKAMRLKNGAAVKTRHQIPTLEEVMLLCKGKIMVISIRVTIIFRKLICTRKDGNG